MTYTYTSQGLVYTYNDTFVGASVTEVDFNGTSWLASYSAGVDPATGIVSFSVLGIAVNLGLTTCNATCANMFLQFIPGCVSTPPAATIRVRLRARVLMQFFLLTVRACVVRHQTYSVSASPASSGTMSIMFNQTDASAAVGTSFLWTPGFCPACLPGQVRRRRQRLDPTGFASLSHCTIGDRVFLSSHSS